MPFQRRRRRFRRRNGRRYGRRLAVQPWYRRKFTAADMASYAWRGVKYLKGLVNSERYKFDVQESVTNILNTGGLNNLVEIAQGDGDGARTGLSIFARSLNIKGYATWNSTSALPQILRVSIVVDNQQIADTAPTFTDIYENNNVVAHLNSDTVGRFSVLRDMLINLSDQKPQVHWEMNIPMKHHIRYNGTAGTDFQRGAIYIVYVSNKSTVDGPSLVYESRLSYHDN